MPAVSHRDGLRGSKGGECQSWGWLISLVFFADKHFKSLEFVNHAIQHQVLVRSIVHMFVITKIEKLHRTLGLILGLHVTGLRRVSALSVEIDEKLNGLA